MPKKKQCKRESWCDLPDAHDGVCINASEAVIEDGIISIKVPVSFLHQIVEGAWAAGGMDTRYRITDAAEFAKELTYALNREEEDGTTPIHRLFDQGILDALDNGAQGIEEHPKQEA